MLQCEIWSFSSSTHKPQETPIPATRPPTNQNPHKHQHDLPWTKRLCFILCANCCVLCLIAIDMCMCIPLLRCWQCPCCIAHDVLFVHVPLSCCLRHVLPPCCSQHLVLHVSPCQMLSVWIEDTILVSTCDAGVNAAVVSQAEVDDEILDEEEECECVRLCVLSLCLVVERRGICDFCVCPLLY